MQLAADAATAVAFGFDEIETTMRVARNAWSNAVACAVGCGRGAWGVLFQCSSEEARNCASRWPGSPRIPRPCPYTAQRKHRLSTGTNTPWSKTFLTAAYASRGIKMSCTSGPGANCCMGFHEGEVIALSRGPLLCLQRGGRARHAEWRHRWRATHRVGSRGRHTRTDGGKCPAPSGSTSNAPRAMMPATES